MSRGAYAPVERDESVIDVKSDTDAKNGDRSRPKPHPFRVFCVDLSAMPEWFQFTAVVVILFSCSLMAAALDELMFKDVPYPLFITTWELFVFTAIALVNAVWSCERRLRLTELQAPVPAHLGLALCMYLGRGFGNTSLRLLSYPTQVSLPPRTTCHR